MMNLSRQTIRAMMLALLLLVTTSVSQAEGVRGSVFAGGTTVDFSDIEKEGKQLAELAGERFLGYLWLFTGLVDEYEISVEKATQASYFGGELGTMVSETTGIGMRVAYLKPTELVVSVTGIGYYDEILDWSTSLEATYVQLMVGGWIENSSDSRVRLRGSAFAGMGYANVKWSVNDYLEISVPFFNRDIPDSSRLKGSGTVIEIGGDVGLPFGDSMLGFLEIGYRIANIEKIEVETDMEYLGLAEKGDILEHIDIDNEKPIEMDFSGAKIALGIRFGM